MIYRISQLTSDPKQIIRIKNFITKLKNNHVNKIQLTNIYNDDEALDPTTIDAEFTINIPKTKVAIIDEKYYITGKAKIWVRIFTNNTFYIYDHQTLKK